MKKLIFGLAVFATSVFGILTCVGLDLLGNYIYCSTGGDYLHGTMEMIGGCLFAFVITAVIGFAVALVGAFTREKNIK